MGEELSLFKVDNLVDNLVGRVGRFYPKRQICIAFYCRVQCQLLNTTYAQTAVPSPMERAVPSLYKGRVEFQVESF